MELLQVCMNCQYKRYSSHTLAQMRKVGCVVSTIWLQCAYVVALDHCPLYIDLLDPLHIYLIHFNMYPQTDLLAKCSKVAMIVNFPYLNVHIRAQGYMEWIEMIQ